MRFSTVNGMQTFRGRADRVSVYAVPTMKQKSLGTVSPVASVYGPYSAGCSSVSASTHNREENGRWYTNAYELASGMPAVLVFKKCIYIRNITVVHDPRILVVPSELGPQISVTIELPYKEQARLKGSIAVYRGPGFIATLDDMLDLGIMIPAGSEGKYEGAGFTVENHSNNSQEIPRISSAVEVSRVEGGAGAVLIPKTRRRRSVKIRD